MEQNFVKKIYTSYGLKIYCGKIMKKEDRLKELKKKVVFDLGRIK